MRAPSLAAGTRRAAPPGPRALCLALLLCLAILATSPPVSAELRIADFSLGLNGHELTVYVILLGAIPPALLEGLGSGIPVHVRFQAELWRYSRFWVDRRILSRVIERQIAYDVVTKAYKVLSVSGETREPYLTKDLREAQRVVSDFRGLKLAAGATLSPEEVYYIRVRADVAASGGSPPLSRLLPFMGSGEEQTPWVSSSLLTVATTQ